MAHQAEGTDAADIRVIGEQERLTGIEELVELLFQMAQEAGDERCHVGYRLLVHRQRRVIVLGFRMLDEEQCRAHLEAFRVVFRVMGLHDGTVEHRLEDVVAVFGGDVCREEDIVDALDVAGLTAARFIVDDTQPLRGLSDVHPVEAIHPSAHSDLPVR